jgi:hypothetical protein
MEWYVSQTQAKARCELFKDQDMEVLVANSTVRSIMQWAEAANLDNRQKRAFQCILALFLLTFYDTPEREESASSFQTNSNLHFQQARQNLLKLKGNEDNADIQLICLLHGQGGSGKSMVINLVKAYVKEYCKGVEYPFTSRTIIITAMSSVAATLLGGETIHSAAHFIKNITKEDKRTWNETCLVVIDKISFTSGTNICLINRRLSQLSQK